MVLVYRSNIDKNEKWKVGNGKREMERGKWKMENGKWEMEREKCFRAP
jgi:hypothetical protein